MMKSARYRNAPAKPRTTSKSTRSTAKTKKPSASANHAGRIRTDIRRAKPSEDDPHVEQAREETHNAWKNFEGQRYMGMKLGSHHKWYYDQGIWKEQKMTPDEWTFNFAVKKRRAGKAPEGTGVPVGTEYHWYVIEHQYVKKLNANIYSTALSGIKFKAGYKRAAVGKWDASEKAQKKRIIRFLKEMLEELEGQLKEQESK